MGTHMKHGEPNGVLNGFRKCSKTKNGFTKHEDTISNGYIHPHQPTNGFKHHQPLTNGFVASEHNTHAHSRSNGLTRPLDRKFRIEPKNGLRPNGVANGYKRSQEPVIQHKKVKTYEEFEQPPLLFAVLTYLGYAVLIVIGHFEDFLQRIGWIWGPATVERGKEDWVPLFQRYEQFYARHVYRPIRDCWSRPICGIARSMVDVKERTSPDNGWTLKETGRILHCINMGSYNYLGFAETEGPCANQTEVATQRYGCGACSSRHELGTTQANKDLDDLVAEFVGVEAAMTCGMGFATNSTCIPTLVSKGCLVVSDVLNHSSIILGARMSGASIRVYKHNDMTDLEEQLRKALIHGQPRTHRPWRKILIICEGIYSMEGSIVKLPEVIRLKKKYKCYLFLDEAHSIGALGRTGRGVVEYHGCDPRDVDVLMGTFTKSFGAAGGYVAGTKEIVNHIRLSSHSTCHSPSMPSPVIQQVITSMEIIMGRDGTREGVKRLGKLAWNTRYFRRRLYEMGFILYGNMDSPVVPLLIYNTSKIGALARICLDHGLAICTIGFPATNVVEGRARLCVSAEHTKEMLDKALEIFDAAGDRLMLKYSRLPPPDMRETDADFIERHEMLPDYSNCAST